ncbi:MAG TPA: DNA polymerase IV, partial [Bacteroidetes bacterium]|nr:DNA polymerase IV [Bacteroidota bacterium]
VHSAMPMKMAKLLCPQAIFLRGDMDSYTKYSNLVTEVIKDSAPTYEKASIDEFYLDLTGMDKYFGCYKWSQELRSKVIKETGLPISTGLSINKLVSKIGTGEAKPNGALEVPQGQEKPFLAPLSVKKIPGIGKVTYKKLSFLGVRKIETLRKIPPKLLMREFGNNGQKLWEKANAIDTTPVIQYSERKSISKERTFNEDTLDIDMIKSLLVDMTEKLAYELRSKSKLTSIITIKIRYADFNTYTRQKKIPYTANDRILLKHVKELFDNLYQRRQLIRLVGVKFSGLTYGYFQMDLFDDNIRDINLMQSLDKIRHRFGINAITRAAAISGR